MGFSVHFPSFYIENPKTEESMLLTEKKLNEEYDVQRDFCDVLWKFQMFKYRTPGENGQPYHNMVLDDIQTKLGRYGGFRAEMERTGKYWDDGPGSQKDGMKQWLERRQVTEVPSAPLNDSKPLRSSANFTKATSSLRHQRQAQRTLVISDHPSWTAKELCEDKAGWGPDFVDIKRGKICRTVLHDLWDLCGDEIKDQCFNLDTKTFTVYGKSKRYTSYETIIDNRGHSVGTSDAPAHEEV
jgi:hypothetical protein